MNRLVSRGITRVGLTLLALGAGCSSSATGSPDLLPVSLVDKYQVVATCPPVQATPFATAVSSLQYSTASTNNKLSLYTPQSGASWPLVVWVHGGGWDNSTLFYNSTFTTGEVVQYLVAKGYAVASVDYRMSTALNNPALMPAQIKDVRCAMMWLKANAATYSVAVRNTVVMGESAGGQLAGMISMNLANGSGFDDPASCAAYPGDATVAGAVLFYPPVDVRSSANMGSAAIAGLTCTSGLDCLTKVLGGAPETVPALASAVSPISHLSTAMAPIFITHGTVDADVMIAPVRSFKTAVAALNRPITMVEVAGADHGYLAMDTMNFWAGNAGYAPSLCTMLGFLAQVSSGQ